MSEPVRNPDELERLRAELAALKPERDALAAEVAQRNAERDEAMAHFRDAWRERSEFAKRIDEADADLAQRTAERDEARRIACSALAAKGVDLATNRGWDCFKEAK